MRPCYLLVGSQDVLQVHHPDRTVLHLLDAVQVDRVIVGAVFLSLEKLDRNLVELHDCQFVEEVQAFDFMVCGGNCVSQLCDFS